METFSFLAVANILYVESPAGVGFSYSNTTADYDTTGDSRTAKDSYVFLINWFSRFSRFKDSDFYIAGESYAGFYIPELAQLIVHKNLHALPSSKIQLKGVMVSTTLPTRIYEYHLSHALISDSTYQGLIMNCVDLKFEFPKFAKKATEETGSINMYDLYSDKCDLNSSIESRRGVIDNCEKLYVNSYPKVQAIMHVKKTPYPWALCRLVFSSMCNIHSLCFGVCVGY
ncbi:Serine carboxypeptidase-like [Thalictrum thalictroides]|uniref:Carboxypeptidase n=1 Tax=Thalictrum thalictroides TaxID=46969 RepID=A0A7J6XCA1_THATH|nr:Serine carboxypeptidase-like [Thalictrum thalictroides]